MELDNSKTIFIINPLTNRSIKTVSKKGKGLHHSLKWILLLAQCCGQMPVTGISNSDPNFLKFKWKSWRCLYTIIVITLGAFINTTYIYIIIKDGSNFYDSTTMVFHFSTMIITILFLKLASEWAKLMKKWSMVEYSMMSYGTPLNLYKRINILSAIFFSAATIEYTMIKTNKLLLSSRCKGSLDILEFYFTKTLYPKIFAIYEYHIWLALPIQAANTLLTFAWTFNDVFIMLISTALALRFQQITARLLLIKKNSKTMTSVSFWRDVREDYNKLSKLTRNVDQSLSYIILASFASNLYFVLVQLFNSMRVLESTIEKVYFFFSFGFLILRTICVSLYGGWVYDESKAPLSILNSVSSDVYNIEIKRFIEQIKFDTVALTGKNFFYVTRGLLLSMAGAVVTYELVLIQFNGNVLKESAEAANATHDC